MDFAGSMRVEANPLAALTWIVGNPQVELTNGASGM